MIESLSIVELCRRIGRAYEEQQGRHQEMSDDDLMECDSGQDAPDFLDVTLVKLSELTGLRREDIADFIHRAAHGANWSEWRRANGSTWADISGVAEKMIAAGRAGVADSYMSWLLVEHPSMAELIGIEAIDRDETEVHGLDQGNSDTEAKVPRTSHSQDYTSVNWFGTRYAFAKGNQAKVVEVLWAAWEQDEHSLTQETIGAEIGSSANRFEMRKTFRRKNTHGRYEPHPAWGTMIQEDSKGCYRLVGPTPS